MPSVPRYPPRPAGQDCLITSHKTIPPFSSVSRGIFADERLLLDRKSTRLNSSHQIISYAVFCLKKKNEHLARRSGIGVRVERHDTDRFAATRFRTPDRTEGGQGCRGITIYGDTTAVSRSERVT